MLDCKQETEFLGFNLTDEDHVYSQHSSFGT